MTRKFSTYLDSKNYLISIHLLSKTDYPFESYLDGCHCWLKYAGKSIRWLLYPSPWLTSLHPSPSINIRQQETSTDSYLGSLCKHIIGRYCHGKSICPISSSNDHLAILHYNRISHLLLSLKASIWCH